MPSRTLNRAIKNYLAEEEGAGEILRQLLEHRRIADAEPVSTEEIRTSLLFTDIVGSSALFDQYGDVYGRRIVAIHDRVVDAVLAARGGTRIKHTGDGILASFQSCGRSVKAALLIQKHVARHNRRFPLLGFQVRIGVNVGSVIEHQGDLLGSSVNLAARLCESAGAGGILTTGIVHARCADKGYEFESRGRMLFKGFRVEIPVFEISWRNARNGQRKP